ncbi:serine hydroxymethyltransferase [Candidatus Saccharibacteria bacterium]|nr:serine hydroxymethyltransferase [Candidatus Saccharibacteria bacterium]
MDKVFELINEEEKRQSEGLELIPSENYASSEVRRALSSVFTNKYSEGYPSFLDLDKDEETIISEDEPNFRYYGGQKYVDKMERLAIARARKLFHADHANVQPHSGANANEAVYFAWLEPGDKILAMDLGSGGHLTHGAPVTRSAKIYNFIPYGVNNEGEIDYEEMERLALAERPKIILVGYSAYMKIPDFARVAEIGKKIGALLMADMAHVAGLIAGGAHPNPLDFGFHVMTSTTHKTLRGPRGGLILSKGVVSSPLKKPEKTLENIPTLIDRAVFPGTQGGPLENTIAAKAVAFGEALRPEFKEYARKVIENAKVLAEELISRGFVLQGGGTENHLILIDIQKSFSISGKEYERRLDAAGLTLNANALPGDQGGAFNPSGVRLGTPAVTTRGMGAPEMKKIAEWMERVAKNEDAAKIREEVRELAKEFPLP